MAKDTVRQQLDEWFRTTGEIWQIKLATIRRNTPKQQVKATRLRASAVRKRAKSKQEIDSDRQMASCRKAYLDSDIVNRRKAYLESLTPAMRKDIDDLQVAVTRMPTELASAAIPLREYEYDEAQTELALRFGTLQKITKSLVVIAESNAISSEPFHDLMGNLRGASVEAWDRAWALAKRLEAVFEGKSVRRQGKVKKQTVRTQGGQQKYNLTEDDRLMRIWKSRRYKYLKEKAKELRIPLKDIRKSIDRARHRRKKSTE